MSAFDNARRFFEACEGLGGWTGCKEFVVAGAPFVCQARALADVTTVEGYCEWVASLGKPMPDSTYELHASGWDAETSTATFFSTFHAVHTGEGGPVPATGKETHSHYVYALKMSPEGKVERMTKVWNAPWALRELGWAS